MKMLGKIKKCLNYIFHEWQYLYESSNINICFAVFGHGYDYVENISIPKISCII